MIRPFGTLSTGEQVEVISLHNESLSCEVITLGATLRTLFVQGKSGPIDVILGYDNLDSYVNLGGQLGATVGRFANRIANGKFTLDSKEYTLALNCPPNHLHGGLVGFDHKVWDIREVSDTAVTLALNSPDGEEGYPGNLTVELTYRLEGSALELHYRAVTDAPTVCNLTNHSYFNLDGQDSGSMLNQELQLFCSRYTPTDENGIPTGEITAVAGTPLDFQNSHPIGEYIHDAFPPLRRCGGYDQNFVVDGAVDESGKLTSKTLRLAALAHSVKTGLTMRTETTLPGIQLYTANGLENVTGKGGVVYAPHHAFCLESQFFPDAINHPQFPSPILRPGDVFDHVTRYVFSR